MLVSLVLFLEPQGAVEMPADLGRAVHAWFLGRVREDNPPLAERLHEGHALRPFTLSPLRGARRGLRWLRITALEPGLAEWLLRTTWPGEIELGPVSFRVQGVTSEPQEHPWAGRATYEALLDRLLGAEEPEARVELEFASPKPGTSPASAAAPPGLRQLLGEVEHLCAPALAGSGAELCGGTGGGGPLSAVHPTGGLWGGALCGICGLLPFPGAAAGPPLAAGGATPGRFRLLRRDGPSHHGGIRADEEEGWPALWRDGYWPGRI